MAPRVVRTLEAQLPGTPVRAIVAAATIVAVASAWFNQGFFSHDEHFQILEFAWYKLGRTPGDALAWEFSARIRPALQPWLAAGLFKGLGALGLFTPLFAAFVLRAASGLLALWISLELCIRTVPWVRDVSLRRLLLPGMLFLWFLPYTHGRFASENWGGLLFFGGLCFVLDAGDSPGVRHSSIRFALAGLLWGAAFYCRFQVGLAIAGAGAWLLLVDRAPLRSVGALTVSFLIACALNVTLDHWLYGEWTFTPYNYLYTNLVEGKAATFGTQPWWFYLAQMLGLLVPPFSPLLVGVLVASVWLCRKNVLVWAVVPFVIGHNLLGHKETRFLVPITYAIVPLLVLGADRLPETLRAKLARWPNPRAAAAAGRAFIALNLLALAVMMFKPSSETAVIYQRLYEESRKGPLVLYTASLLPYSMAGNAVNFYRPENVTVKTLGDVSELRTAMAASPGHVFFFQQSLQPPDWMAAGRIACTPVARTLPLWARRFNLNNWMSKMYQWSVFSVTPASTTGGC
jgi:phosphatidylinositol glycan class B